MILSDLRDYIKCNRRVILNDLVIHFDIEADALRGMLRTLSSKGKIRKASAEKACGTSCCKCDPAMTEIYEWNESAQHQT